jgi:hypothetical protein
MEKSYYLASMAIDTIPSGAGHYLHRAKENPKKQKFAKKENNLP